MQSPSTGAPAHKNMPLAYEVQKLMPATGAPQGQTGGGVTSAGFIDTKDFDFDKTEMKYDSTGKFIMHFNRVVFIVKSIFQACFIGVQPDLSKSAYSTETKLR